MKSDKPTNDDGGDFPFDVGDTVRVNVREHGETGRSVAKFEAECKRIGERITRPNDHVAVFDMPWGRYELVRVQPDEAVFEVVDRERN